MGYDAGTVRLHFPVVSAREAAFELDGIPVVMEPGECWYLDFRRPHAAVNGSAERRVHLVVDCSVNDWLSEVFIQAVAVGPMTHSR